MCIFFTCIAFFLQYINQPGGYAGNQIDAYERRLRSSDKDERATNLAQGHAPMVLGEVHLRGESNQGLRNQVAANQHGLFGNPKVGLLILLFYKTSHKFTHASSSILLLFHLFYGHIETAFRFVHLFRFVLL